MVFTQVAGVLLAAGQGSRFGRPKALVELDGQTLAERGIGMLRAGGADPVLIVTGAAQVGLGPDYQVRTVRNDDWRTGMGSSLRAVGMTEAELARLRSPIGLDLGARTPEETAVSIAAELIQLRWGGTGHPLTSTEGRIHHQFAG